MSKFLRNFINPEIKSEIKNNLTLSLPLIASQLVYASSPFVSTAMVARLGKDALAASVLISMIWFLCLVIFFGILNAVTVMVSHQYGARNYRGISETMGQGFILSGIICVFMFAVLQLVPLFLHWSAQPPVVLQLGHEYLHAMLWTIPSMVFLVFYEQFLTAIGRPKIVLRCSLLIIPIEIPLIYCLIFGKLGLPACGIAGVGYGLAVTFFVTLVGMVIYLVKAKYYQPYQIFARINTFNWNIQKEFLRVGLPMGFMHVIEVSAFTIMTFMIGHFGTVTLAAHQILMQYLGFAVNIVFAMSQAVSIRVGHAVGQQNLTDVKQASYVGVYLNFLLISLVALIFMLVPKFLIALDLQTNTAIDFNLVKQAQHLLFIGAIFLMLENFRIIGFGALRALKDTYFSMITSLIGFWIIGISLAFILGFTLNFKGPGIWWGLTLGIATATVIVLARLRYLLQKVDLAKLI